MANAKYLGEVSLTEGEKLTIKDWNKRDFTGEFNIVWRDPVTKKAYKAQFTVLDRLDEEVLGLPTSIEEVAMPQYFTLILGACRPQMLKRILEVVGLFPIEKVFLVASERAEKSYLSSKILKDQGYLKYLEKGVEQAGIPNIPEVQVVDKFWTLGEKLDFKSYKIKLVCDGRSEVGIGQFVQSGASVGKSLLAIGPESGWDEKEMEVFSKWNFQAVHMGKGILRVDVALISALSILRSDIY